MSSEKSPLSTENCDQDQSSHHVEINQQLSAMRPTFVEIIQQRKPFDKFLLSSFIGQQLVSHGLLEDPLVKAQNQFRQDVNILAQQFHRLGVAASHQEAIQIVLQQPDFSPRDADAIYLETVFDRVFYSRLSSRVTYGDIDHDAGSLLDLEKEMRREIQNISVQTRANIHLTVPEVIHDKTVVHLRERILSFIEFENWSRLLDLLANNYSHPVLQSPLHQVLSKIAPSLFTNKNFRAFAFRHMIKFRVDKGAKAVENFDEYLADLGLQFPDSAECHQYADEDFLQRQLSGQWERGDHQEYFQSIQFLFEIKLLPIDFFNENKNHQFFKNFYEFGLLAMYGENSSFKQHLNSLAQSWGLPPNKQITLSNQHHFSNRYCSLCGLLEHPLHPKIAKLFPQKPRERDLR